jgi:hypothetical protein
LLLQRGAGAVECFDHVLDASIVIPCVNESLHGNAQSHYFIAQVVNLGGSVIEQIANIVMPVNINP